MAKPYGYHAWTTGAPEIRGLHWVFMPRYTVIKPTMPIPTMEKKVSLAFRDWRYDSMSRKIVDFNSYPPAVGGKAFGVVNQSSLFASPTFITYQGDGYINQRVRLKDLKPRKKEGSFNDVKPVIDIQGLPPMGVLPVGTVLTFSGYLPSGKPQLLFEQYFGKASFAKKLQEWRWVIVDNINANAMGIVDDERVWSGNCTYRLLRIKSKLDVDIDWSDCYTPNKTNMVDLQSDKLHDLLRASVENKYSPELVEAIWKKSVAQEGEQFGYGVEGKLIPQVDPTAGKSINDYVEDFMNIWFVFCHNMDYEYKMMLTGGCVHIDVDSSRNLITSRPNVPVSDYLSSAVFELSPQYSMLKETWAIESLFYEKQRQEVQYRKEYDYHTGRPVKSSFLIPFFTNQAPPPYIEGQREWIVQHSCYASLLSPLIKPNYEHKNDDPEMAWVDKLYHAEHAKSRAWRQGFADFIGLDLWDLDNPQGGLTNILEFLDYPLIWYILRWLNGKPSFGGPLWADYQQDVEYIYEWVGEGRKPDIEYKRELSLF